MKTMLQTEIERKRAEFWAENKKPSMSFTEICELSERLINLFPLTEEERERRAKGMENVPEFVL